MNKQTEMADTSFLTNHDKQNELTIPASPNWYCSANAACNGNGLYGFAARNSIFVFDINGRIPVCKQVYQYHKERVTSFCWLSCKNASPALLVSGSEDGWVKVFSITEKKVIGEHKKHQVKVTAIGVLQDGSIVSGDDKGVLALWNYETETISTWLPVPSSAISIAASLHKQGLLAVGYANGHVLVSNIKSRVIIQQFKSHSDEVQSVVWQPLSYKDLQSRNDQEQQNDGLLLASGSKDKSIKVWNTQKESPILSMNLPTRNAGQKGRRKMDEMNRAKIWLTLCWYKRDSIISSSMSGELLAWDLRTKDHIVISPAHSRMVFSICYDQFTNKMMTTSMDRQILVWDADSYSLHSTMPSLGGYVYSLSSSYLDPHSIIYGVGDNLIRVWNTRFEERPYETSILWQGIKSKVTVVECHPSKENLIGFGTDDGHVGVYNIASGKFEVSISYHKKTVYSISWGPHCGDSSDSHCSDANRLYSCGGEGTVFIHSMNNLQNKARDMNAIIKRTNSIKEKLPSRSDIEWKGDCTLIAVGNDDGSIEVFESPDLRHVCTILVHRKIINCMKWHHHFDIPNRGREAAYSNWLASGSSDNYVCITDLTAAIDEYQCSQKATTIKEKFRHFNLHGQRITCLSWSPHTLGLLSSSSYDGTVQVWNCIKDEQIANFRGHSGRVLSVLWSFIDPDIIYSGGEDFTLRKWSIASCKEMLPPANKKQSGTAAAKYVKSKSPSTKVSVAINESLDSCSVNEHFAAQGSNMVDVGNVTPSVNKDDTRVLTLNETHSREDECRTSADNQRNEKLKVAAAVTTKKSTTKESKKKKAKSLLPLTASQNHKQKTASQQECVLLAKYLQGSSNECQANPQQPFEPGTEDYVNLGLFGDKSAAFKMFATEGQSHGNSGNMEQQLHLELWKGNLGNALNICKEKGELNEMVVAMSPLGGFEVWQATMCAFADQLASKGDYHAAATYYVASNKVYKAIEMFKAQNMIKEAIALAKVRLPSKDPTLIELYQLWGEKQNAEGCYENAAKCYIAAGDHETAIKILARKGDVNSLKTAAEVALIFNVTEKADLYLKQCAEALLNDMKWKEFRDVVKMMSNKMGFTLLGIIHEVLMQFLRGTENDLSLNISSILDSNACFTIPTKTQESCGELPDSDEPCCTSQPTQFLQIVCNIFFAEFKTFPSGKAIHEMNIVESKLTQSNAANIDLKRVIISVSNHIMRGITSLQDGKSNDCVSSWLQALDICYRSCQFEMLELLYNLLFPRNFSTLETLIRSTAHAEHHDSVEGEVVRDLYRNCQSFQYVSILYQFWWKQFPQMVSKIHIAKDGNSDACKRAADSPNTELDMGGPDVMIDSNDHQRNQFYLPPKYDLKITFAQFIPFISGLCFVLLSSNHARKDQLKRRIQELDQQLLEARIKKQLRQHIKDRSEQLNKKQTNKNAACKKPIPVIQREKHSVHDSNWRATEIKAIPRKNEGDSTECDQTKVQNDNNEPSIVDGNESSSCGVNTKEIDLLGHEIDVVDDQSLELMTKENEMMKKELQSLVSQIQDAPFVDSLESAKIILHVISQTLKNGLMQDIVANEKLNQISKDVIKWASKCSLIEDDKSYFEQYGVKNTAKLMD